MLGPLFAPKLKKMPSISGNPVVEEHALACCGRITRTVVTSDSDVICAWILLMMQTYKQEKKGLVVGLAIKWRCDSNNPVITLCIGFHCLVIQTLHAALPQKLFSFLAEPHHFFVGFGIEVDAKKLRKDYNLVVERVVDLRNLEARELKKLVSQVLWIEFEMEKRWRVTLDCEKLSLEHLRNLCIDAYVSSEVGRFLQARSHCSIPVLQERAQEDPTFHQIIKKQKERLFAIFEHKTIWDYLKKEQ